MEGLLDWQSCLVVQCTCVGCTAWTAFSIERIAFEKSKWFSLQTIAFWSKRYELKRVMEPRDCWKNFPPNHGRWLLLRSCWSRLIQRVLWADRLTGADQGSRSTAPTIVMCCYPNICCQPSKRCLQTTSSSSSKTVHLRIGLERLWSCWKEKRLTPSHRCNGHPRVLTSIQLITKYGVWCKNGCRRHAYVMLRICERDWWRSGRHLITELLNAQCSSGEIVCEHASRQRSGILSIRCSRW